MKLWDKGTTLQEGIEQFTVGNDYLLDKKLVKYDCLASIAHAKMLASIGLLTADELQALVEGLQGIIALDAQGQFVVTQEDEDCHTAIENHLTATCGEAGKKIHLARSRNDQVLTALWLFEKEELHDIKVLITGSLDAIAVAIQNYGDVAFPGYTHMQKAMPTDVKTWLGSFADALQDDLLLLEAALTLLDKSPLGSAAGFGVPVFEVDKKLTAQELHFTAVMENPMHCQLSRGKYEAQVVNVLSAIMLDLNKLATDLLFFSTKEFGLVELPPEICTGSSMMPHKKNPDVLELLRAKYSVVLGEEFKIKSLLGNLMSGYNRDVQLTKEPLMNALATTKACLKVMPVVLLGMKLNVESCRKAMTSELYATQEAYELVKQGMPFREAYKTVGKKYLG